MAVLAEANSHQILNDTYSHLLSEERNLCVRESKQPC